MTNTFAAIFENDNTRPAVLTTKSSDPPSLSLTYQQLHSQASRFISQAQTLLGSNYYVGLPIASMLGNGLPCLLAFLGTALMRSIAAPLNPAMKQSEIEFYLQDSQSKVLIVSLKEACSSHQGILAATKLGLSIWTIQWSDPEGIIIQPYNQTAQVFDANSSPPQTADFAQIQPNDTALLLHTSGTTGRPKAVPLTHANIIRSMFNIAQTYNLSPQDRTFVVMPLFHVHGLIGSLMSTLYSGGSVVLPQKYSASSFWSEFIASESNWYSAVPTIHQIQLQHELPNNLPHIRFIRSCSASLAPTVLTQIEAAFNAPVLEAYAMTEASHQMCSNPLPPLAHKPASVGIPQGVQVAILDDQGHRVHLGEVCIRGSNVTTGYLNNPSANESSFTNIYNKDSTIETTETLPGSNELWFRTGDQGYLDEDGYLFLTGRIKELINRGGEKISPLEIDAVLLQYPDVLEAISFAVDHELYGQEVNAAVILKPGSTASEQSIKDFVGRHLAAFKVPKVIFISDILPKTATGKIQRRVVSDYFTKKA
ncbi:hypothetical protein BB561_001459 [Smittium simulii]|uniref:AMP-dependent synthetase/ligase domain-containing protein n=1 Tax=Smittium simulii TaxID=133385 RepID=A0A2T9YUH8_9FUNG|nr:hypothetical protein BB561_001459 [Smittium simulii]